MEPGMRVLLVDDDRVSRTLLRKHLDVLSPEGLLVDESPDAEEASRLLGEHAYDLVVADHLMPGKTGLDLLEEVRRRQPDAARVLMTAYGTMPLAVEAINRGGVSGYLQKPFLAGEVARVVGAVLERRKR